jgi:hypothetical protein
MADVVMSEAGKQYSLLNTSEQVTCARFLPQSDAGDAQSFLATSNINGHLKLF